jgi:HEAT repeat protein
MEQTKNQSFQTVVHALLDESNPFPAVYLHRFSDISSLDLRAISEIWPQVPLARRQALMEDLEDLADVDTLLSFKDFSQFALHDEDPRVRMFAIRLLWEEDDKSLIRNFLDLMHGDPDVQVRATAANALGHFVYLGEVEEIPEEILHDIEDALLQISRSTENSLLRRRALESLGYSSRPEVLPLIEAAYNLEDTDWQASALFAMGRSADRRWQKHILETLDHPDSAVRMEAVRAAGELELTKARPMLLDMAQDEEVDDVRFAAFWSLSQIGGRGVRPVLERLLEESEDDEEADLLEDALENLTFTDETQFFDMLDFDLEANPKPENPDEDTDE